MSTRSRIGILYPDGKIQSIYCHFDGDSVGDILNKYYTNIDKIHELIKLGDISYLAPEIGEKQNFDRPNRNWTLAYGRDREETGIQAKISPNLQYFLHLASEAGRYAYLYNIETGEWTTYSKLSGDWSDGKNMEESTSFKRYKSLFS
jgi:hypothetical protein